MYRDIFISYSVGLNAKNYQFRIDSDFRHDKVNVSNYDLIPLMSWCYNLCYEGITRRHEYDSKCSDD